MPSATAPEIDLLLYDVFTDVPFAGNPLAVAVDAPSLTDDQHQRIAAEVNLSETIFLRRRAADDGWDARIFTPARELPFAGHPTIGAAIALADRGLVDGEVVLHERAGAVPVAVADGGATLTAPGIPTPVADEDPGDIAACLGLEIADLHGGFGPRGWSAGVPFTIVVVRDVDTLARARVDLATWEHTLALGAAPDLYVLTPLDGDDGERWQARMFGPGVGIVEDPATGSAAAALGGFLAGRVRPGRLRDGWTILQGVEMGRPSTIRLGAVVDGNELRGVTIGGAAVRVGRSTLTVPEAAT